MTDPLHAPYSFRGGLLWSFWELAKFSLPIRLTKPIPNDFGILKWPSSAV